MLHQPQIKIPVAVNLFESTRCCDCRPPDVLFQPSPESHPAYRDHLLLQGLHDTNNLLGVLGLGIDGHDSPTPNIDSDLSSKVVALIRWVINSQDDLAALPLVGRPTSVNVGLLLQSVK